MPLPDVAAPIKTAQALPVRAVLGGWGGIGGARAQVLRPADLSGFRSALSPHSTGAIARGMGRSYGDAAQLEGGLILDTTLLKAFELDASSGAVDAQAGTTIGELLHALVPAGWMVPVVPGTQHVTVGGAIASDIHGKNHGTAGTFGSHVRALSLLSASGEVLELEPGSDGGLFEATLGGMGLTGVILSARIQLRPVSSPLLAVDTDRVEGLDEALAALSETGGPHRVAWLDLLGSRAGRGIVTRADHLPAADVPPQARGRATVAARATVPARWPAGALRPGTIRAFNELRFRSAPRRQRGHVEQIGSHMFPLDALNSWPRLYGPRGFVQYQLVVPPGSVETVRNVIAHLRQAQVPCYLAVLKDFGPANGAPLSFPISGWTLALDLPRAVPGLEAALRHCDELVVQAGGRVYLTKDARLRPEMVRAMYPRLQEWQSIREAADPDGLWRSDLAIRTGLIDPEDR